MNVMPLVPRPKSGRSITLEKLAIAALIGALTLPPITANAAVSDVIVWNAVRTQIEREDTLQNGYSSSSGMRLWWKLNEPNNLGLDSTTNGRHATINGVVQGLTMTDPFGTSRVVATGFNTDDSFIVGNPGFANGSTASCTYEFWIRNPAKNGSVFFSITRSAAGQIKSGDPADLKRMWVNVDGSITMADLALGSSTPIIVSGPLTWTPNKWYQIIVDCSYLGSGQQNVKVYRGTRDAAPSHALLFDYSGSSSGTEHWLAIGGHPESYQGALRDDVGKGGFLGCDGNGQVPGITAGVPAIRPETYRAVDDEDDTAAWRRACAVISAYGQGILELTAGKTYRVGKYSTNPSPNSPYYVYEGLGRIAGARHGKITVKGNGATVKLNDNMYVGGFNPTTGASLNYDLDTRPSDPLKLYAAQPGNLLTLESCVELEVKDLTLDGNIQNQIYGGIYGDKGYQLKQHGIFLGGTKAENANDSIWIHDVVSSYNTVDGISISNRIEAVDPIKTIRIERMTCQYNGRQGLSYNCGNHLEVYDSEFSYTGRLKPDNPNSPACGVDVEPLGRYTAPGALFDNCRFFDNRAYGLMLLNAPPAIIRDCTLWGTTNYALKVGHQNAADVDHLFVRSKIYGGYYSSNASRIRFEQCSFLTPEVGDANSAYPGEPVAKNHGIEQVGTMGSVILSGCDIQALHAWTQTDPTATSAYIPHGLVLQNCVVTHGNWSSTQTKPAVAGRFSNSYFINTTFRETDIFSYHRDDIYWINAGSSTVGPGCSIEGPTPRSAHYVSWNTSGGTRPIAAHALPVNALDGVLTPNADPGEFRIETGATYTTSHAFTSPADDTGTRLFDRDAPEFALGSNRRELSVTIDLHSSHNVRSVRMRMNQPAKPPRVTVLVGDEGNWTMLGLIRPVEGAALAPWFDATAARPVAGQKVKLVFESDNDDAWHVSELKVYGAPPLTTPTIASFSPATINVGQSLTIYGTGFTPAAIVTIGGVEIDPALISDRSSSTIVISSVPIAANSGAIAVTTPGGAATSASEVVVVAPPIITQHPASQTATVGNTVTFTVAATSNAPVEYKWRRNGVIVFSASGALGATFVLPNITVANAGTYDCQVSNSAGTTTSNPATLTVNKAVATVTLANLVQAYDGTPRLAAVTSVPGGLSITITYNGMPTPPRLPARYNVVATVNDLNYTGSASAVLDVSATVFVRHGPTVNGGIHGSLQVAEAEAVTLNGSAYISGDLLIVGTPSLRANGQPTYAGIVDEPGQPLPNQHTVTLNGSAVLRYLVRRVDAVALPTVLPPPLPTGDRDVSINSPSQAVGNFATLRHLTLNGNAGVVSVPPGTYGRFIANSNTAFVLGTSGSMEPAHYNLQSLTLNGNARMVIESPVILTLANDATLQGNAGTPAQPGWLILRLSGGQLTLNGNITLSAHVVAPHSTVTINSGHLKGSAVADRLVVNDQGLIEDANRE